MVSLCLTVIYFCRDEYKVQSATPAGGVR